MDTSTITTTNLAMDIEDPSKLAQSLEAVDHQHHVPSVRCLDTLLEQACRSHDEDDESLLFVFLRQKRYWALFLCLGVANSSDATEILCLSYILSDDTFSEHILHHTPWRAGLLAATVFAGMLLGGLIVGGSWGDAWGRRPVLVMGLATNALAGLLSSVAGNVYLLSLWRFVAGVGIGTTIPPLFTLCTELASPRHRGLCVTIAASFWMVGSLYVAGVGWWWLGVVQGSWRVFAAACALPSAIGGVLVWQNVPESPRFLLLQGDYRAAVQVVHVLADRLQFAGEPWTEEEARETAPAPSSSSVTNHHRSSERITWRRCIQIAWRDFVTSASQLYVPSLRRTTLPLQMVWFSLSFGTYGLYTWINTLFFELHLRNVYLNALLFAASNLPGNLLSAFLMDRVGRAPLLTGSVLAASLSLVIFAFVAATRSDDDKTSSTTSWVVASSCAFQMFTIVSWNSIDVLTAELFPTAVRATGMGLCAASGRIGALLAQFINGALVAHPAALLLVAAVTLLWGAITPALLPADATGQPVQDTVVAVGSRSGAPDTGPQEMMQTHPNPSYSYQHLEANSQ